MSEEATITIYYVRNNKTIHFSKDCQYYKRPGEYLPDGMRSEVEIPRSHLRTICQFVHFCSKCGEKIEL